MEPIKAVIYTFIISLLAVLFYNCAPLAEKGNFIDESIKITGFDSQNDDNSGDNDNSDDNDSSNDNDNSDDNDSSNDNDNSDDNDSSNDNDNNDNKEPVGEEFEGSQTPEAGPAPITRSLY